MEEEKNLNPSSDIKDMQKLLIDKSNIGSAIPVTYDKLSFKKYNIKNPPQNAKRILNSFTVKYFSQAYLFDEISQKFEQFDKSYKNIKKDKISNMSADKKWIRCCLLLMLESEQSIFEINKETLGDFYQAQVDKLIADKKSQKIKELKEIEREKIREKREKEIEELKKKGEYVEGVVPSKNPPPPRPKQELKIDMTIVDNIPNNYKFDGKIYYRIYTEFVQIERPAFPNKAEDLRKYVIDFNEEIKRLLLKDKDLSKEESNNKNIGKHEYINIAETWCNELINKIFNMGKGKIKEAYESNKKLKEAIDNEMKKPVLNLMFIYSKKMDNNNQIIRQAINLAENTYFKKYRNQFDTSFLKISGRYLDCLIKLNDFSKAKKILEIIKTKCKELPEAEQIIKYYESSLEKAEKKKNNENILESKGKIKAASDASKPDYDWQQGQNEDELDEALNKDVEQVKNNMKLVNSSK
jgi:predicted RecB family endonuclease